MHARRSGPARLSSPPPPAPILGLDVVGVRRLTVDGDGEHGRAVEPLVDVMLIGRAARSCLDNWSGRLKSRVALIVVTPRADEPQPGDTPVWHVATREHVFVVPVRGKFTVEGTVISATRKHTRWATTVNVAAVDRFTSVTVPVTAVELRCARHVEVRVDATVGSVVTIRRLLARMAGAGNEAREHLAHVALRLSRHTALRAANEVERRRLFMDSFAAEAMRIADDQADPATRKPVRTMQLWKFNANRHAQEASDRLMGVTRHTRRRHGSSRAARAEAMGALPSRLQDKHANLLAAPATFEEPRPACVIGGLTVGQVPALVQALRVSHRRLIDWGKLPMSAGMPLSAMDLSAGCDPGRAGRVDEPMRELAAA